MTSILNKDNISRAYHGAVKHFNLAVIFILIGISVGFKIASAYFDYRMNEAVKLQGFIHNNTVYEIKIKL